MLVAKIPREEHLRCYWDYQPGQHAAWFEPTQQGKTFHEWQCLEMALLQNPGLRAVVLMPKSRSPATRRWAERLGFQIISDWPPPARWGRRPPPGYVLWPEHLTGVPPEVNRKHLGGVFRKAMTAQYRAGESLTVADDAHILAPLLGLNTEFEELLTAGAEGGAGLWLAAQKTSGSRATGSLTTFAYSQPDQFFLGYEPIEINRQRFNDIGGVDHGVVSRIVSQLPRHKVSTPSGVRNISEKLHIDLRGPYLAQVTGL